MRGMLENEFDVGFSIYEDAKKILNHTQIWAQEMMKNKTNKRKMKWWWICENNHRSETQKE